MAGTLAPRVERGLRAVGQRLVREFPSARRPCLDFWARYVEMYARVNSWRHARRFARRTHLRPFELLRVDPADIEYLVDVDGYPQQTKSTAPFLKEKYKYAGTVHGGDWDIGTVRFEETDVFRAFVARFEEGRDWQDTVYFDRVVDYIDDGIEMWGCPDRSAFERRCARIDRLYDRIRTEGYRTQRAVVGATGEDPMGACDLPWIIRFVYNELTVCIGRDGSFRFFDGRNRLAIAKLLELDTIPVWVMVRHPGWQATREELAGTPAASTLPSELRGHPDLRGTPDG